MDQPYQFYEQIKIATGNSSTWYISNNQDDCEDCVRQRAQNNALIAIYSRLQNIKNRTTEVRRSVDIHMTQTYHNKVLFQQLQDKLASKPKIGNINKTNNNQYDILGYQIAKDIAEASQILKLQKDNANLKCLIKEMHKQRRNQINLSYSYSPNIMDIKLKPNNRINLKDLRNIKLPQISERNPRQKQHYSTKSSNFVQNQTKKQSINHSELNLWLYDNPKNTQLEQELQTHYVLKKNKLKKGKVMGVIHKVNN